MDNFTKYEILRDRKITKEHIYLIAQADRLDNVTCIRMLRKVFKLSLVEAKEVTIVAEGYANSLREYQEKFILPALEEVLNTLEQEPQN